MNKLYLLVTLTIPVFSFFGNLVSWFQRNKQPVVHQTTMHEQIMKNLILKNIHINSFGAERANNRDELGVEVPSIPRYKKHDRVFKLKPIVVHRKSAIPDLADNNPAINRQEWDLYRKKRHKKIYHDHKMVIDKHGEPYRLNDEDN